MFHLGEIRFFCPCWQSSRGHHQLQMLTNAIPNGNVPISVTCEISSLALNVDEEHKARLLVIE